MYIIDDKNLDFYYRILHALTGRGVNCIPFSDIEVTEKSKPVGTFIANVDQSFDCVKNQEFLTFLKKNKFKKALLLKYGCSNFSYKTHFNDGIIIVDIPVEFNDDTNLSLFYLHIFLELQK